MPWASGLNQRLIFYQIDIYECLKYNMIGIKGNSSSQNYLQNAGAKNGEFGKSTDKPFPLILTYLVKYNIQFHPT